MFTALPALAILAVLGAVLAIGHRNASADDRRRESAEIAASAALNARGYLDDRFDVMAAVSVAPAFRDRTPELHGFLVAAAQAGGLDSLGFIDGAGIIRASSTDAEPPAVSLADRTYVRGALAGRPSVSDVLQSRTNGHPALAFGYPATGGLVGGGLRLDEVGTALRRLLGDASLIVDTAGHVVVGPEPVAKVQAAPRRYPLPRMRARRSGVMRAGDRILGFATIKGTRWLLIVDRDYGAVIGPLDRALWLEIAALVLFAGIGTALTFLFARRLDRLDRAREDALAEQREIALTLQRSLLPDLAVPAGLTISAGYVPAQGVVAVGGDWYDLVETGDGRVAFDVGDVAGHGLQAAVTMGKLRSAARMEGLHGSGPVEALTALDRFAGAMAAQPLATVAYAVLDPATGVLRYALAGHPPPLLIHADGTTTYLEEGRSPLLGVPPVAPREEAEVTLAPGDVVLVYTDGLVERPEASIDDGLAILARRAARLRHDVEAMAATLLATVSEPRRDDAAVLAVALQPSSVAS